MAQAQALPEAFVVCECESFVLADRTTKRATEHVAPEPRDTAMVKVIAGIQRAVPQEFIGAAMELVRSRGSRDVDLGTGTLAVFGSVSVLHDGEFAHRIHTQKLSAHSTRRVVDFGCAGEFDTIH